MASCTHDYIGHRGYELALLFLLLFAGFPLPRFDVPREDEFHRHARPSKNLQDKTNGLRFGKVRRCRCGSVGIQVIVKRFSGTVSA